MNNSVHSLSSTELQFISWPISIAAHTVIGCMTYWLLAKCGCVGRPWLTGRPQMKPGYGHTGFLKTGPTRPFYGSLNFVRDNTGETAPEQTFTHSRLSWSSVIPYLLLPSIIIHGILPMPSVLWCCWLGGRKGIRPVKNRVVGCWRGCLGWGADLHIAQQMPLPLTISRSSKSRLVLTFLVLPFWYLLTRVSTYIT